MNAHPLTIPTAEEYSSAFEAERARDYPAVTAFEQACGYAVDRDRLEAAAKILACPVKANPPNWQHGRVLYAAMRRYLSDQSGPVLCLDIGTAKGFSALVARWALNDAGVPGRVESVDVIDPLAKAFRNSVLDVTRENRLADYLRGWPEAADISFYQSTGIDWLKRCADRVHVAFVDGKHSSAAVTTEGQLLSILQRRGDLVVFDDVQMPGVAQAVEAVASRYHYTRVQLTKATRAYVVGVRT